MNTKKNISVILIEILVIHYFPKTWASWVAQLAQKIKKER